MPLKPDQLPDDLAALKALVVAKDAALEAAQAEAIAAKNGLLASTLTVEHLKFQLAKLRGEKYGASSERIERAIAQLELKLEEVEAAQAEAVAPATASNTAAETSAADAPTPDVQLVPTGSAPAGQEPATKKRRRELPPELPRTDVVHSPGDACKTCGGHALRQVGEAVTEVLSYIPGRFAVTRHVRPACSCAKCETMMQAPMPELPIPRGMADASVLAHIAVAKFCDHIPLYRQAEIDARAGVDIDRSQRAEWLGHVAWLVRPLAERIGAHVMAGRVIHADDTPVDVLAPGNGKTKTGRLWVYLRDERAHAGADAGGHPERQQKCVPPAVLYRYTPDRKGCHPRAELKDFVGYLQADGYSGFDRLYEVASGAQAHLVHGAPRVAEVACWSHVRRGFFDVHKATGSTIAFEALERIGALFDIERLIAGKSPEKRVAVRQLNAKPRLVELAVWLDRQLALIPGRSRLAGAIRYARSRWRELTRYLDDGRLELSNNAAENAIRPVAVGRKNWLFAGSDAGGVRAATFYTLIRTARLNGLDPEAYLREIIARIGSHPINRLDELLPWNIAAAAALSAAAPATRSVAA